MYMGSGRNKDKDKENDRRGKRRFSIARELRFKVLDSPRGSLTGIGNTVDISSGGIAFETVTSLAPGSLIEMSISWPVLLDQTCLMRLVVLGRVVRTRRQVVACTVDKYEFRTQARTPQRPGGAEVNSTLRRWALNGEREMTGKAAFGG
jgi:PilZ domain